MCGIAGWISFHTKYPEECLFSMMHVLRHRGPDSKGHSFLSAGNAQLALGHLRLAIIDLSPLSHQPMVLGELSMIYNGEIYNYLELKQELLHLGHTFIAHSDTEVLLHAYQEWGNAAFEKCIGMFAVVIWDGYRKELILARDRTGTKPLYYAHYGDTILFASEMKALMAHPAFQKDISQESLKHYFEKEYISAPQTIFNNTYKLKPGSILTIQSETKQLHERIYWDVFDVYKQAKPLGLSYESALTQLENLLVSAAHYRLRSDVSVSLLLSGGYDSSLVAALVSQVIGKNIEAYTLGFHDTATDEAPFATVIAKHLGLLHHVYYPSNQDIIETFLHIPDMYDEPSGDVSILPVAMMSKQIQQRHTVVLSADGGDEIFAGYNYYLSWQKYLQKLRNIPAPILKLLAHAAQLTSPRRAEILTLLSRNKGTQADTFISYGHHVLFPSELDSLFVKGNKDPHYPIHPSLHMLAHPLSKMLAWDTLHYLSDDILYKMDRASMFYSIENREPLLDHRIIEFMAQVPPEWKIQQNQLKYMAKSIVHKYIPQAYMNRPKQGFSPPFSQWMRTILRPYLDTYIHETSLQKQGIFVPSFVLERKRKFLAGDNQQERFIRDMLLFQMWYERWM